MVIGRAKDRTKSRLQKNQSQVCIKCKKAFIYRAFIRFSWYSMYMKKRDEIKKKLKSIIEDELVDLFINKENELSRKNGKLNKRRTSLIKKR